MKTDFENDEGDITKSHFMGLNNSSKDDLGISDSSNTERQNLDDLLDNEKVGRLDTYSFSYTGNFGDYFREKDYYEDDEDNQDQRDSKPKRRRRK